MKKKINVKINRLILSSILRLKEKTTNLQKWWIEIYVWCYSCIIFYLFSIPKDTGTLKIISRKKLTMLITKNNKKNPQQYTLIENILVTFVGRCFPQKLGISMVTICARLLARLFHYSYEANFLRELLRKKRKKLAISLSFIYHNGVDLLTLNN